MPLNADAQWGHNPNCTGVVTCNFCSGFGMLPCGYSYMICTYCGGSGKQRCAYCAGKKAAEEIQRNNITSGGGNIKSNKTNTNNDRRSSRRKCPGCDGSGKGPDQITYATDYTGNSSYVYCSTCGRTTSRHTHHRPDCRTCYGKGYVE